MFVRTNLQTRKWLSRSGVFQNLLVEKIEPAPLQDENFHFWALVCDYENIKMAKTNL